MTKKVPLSVSISEEARKILDREAGEFAHGTLHRPPLGDLVDGLVRYFEDFDGNWDGVRQEIEGDRAEKVQERQRKDRERKRRYKNSI
jgi:hypothetical protein